MSFTTNAAAIASMRSASVPMLTDQPVTQSQEKNSKADEIGRSALSSVPLSVEQSTNKFLEMLSKKGVTKLTTPNMNVSIGAINPSDTQMNTEGLNFYTPINKNVYFKYHDHQILDYYKGGYSDGKLNGEGFLRLLNGSYYKGFFEDGSMTNGTFSNDSYTYTGDFYHGQPEGHGEMFFDPGHPQDYKLYIGNFIDGEFNGYGRLKFQNGDKYFGEFCQGMPNGAGEMTFADDHPQNFKFYKGDFNDGGFCGFGRLEFQNGDEYVGEFINNEFDGTGTYYTKISNTYETGYYLEGIKQSVGEDI